MTNRSIDPKNLQWLNAAVGNVAAQLATRHGVLVTELFSARCKSPGAVAARRELLGMLARQLVFRQERDGVLHFRPMEKGETLPPAGYSWLLKPMLVRLASLDRSERVQWLGRTRREILKEQADKIRAVQESFMAFRRACTKDVAAQLDGSALLVESSNV